MDKNNNLFNIFIAIYIVLICYIIYNKYTFELFDFSMLNYDIDNIKYIDKNTEEFNDILSKIRGKTRTYYSNIVLITSKIIVSSKPFSYVENRSIYSTETRYEQTLDTIESIRKKIPDSCIFLIDNSNLDRDMYNKLNELCDVFINPIYDKKLKYYTDRNIYKSIAEGYQIMYFLDLFKQLDIKFDRFFKISGRYYLNNKFKYNKFLSNNIIFSSNNEFGIFYYTCFYMIPYTKFNLYENSYKILYNNIKNTELVENSIEFILPQLIGFENIKLVNRLGVTQRIAVWNEVVDI
jgi:hypothetical protein